MASPRKSPKKNTTKSVPSPAPSSSMEKVRSLKATLDLTSISFAQQVRTLSAEALVLYEDVLQAVTFIAIHDPDLLVRFCKVNASFMPLLLKDLSTTGSSFVLNSGGNEAKAKILGAIIPYCSAKDSGDIDCVFQTIEYNLREKTRLIYELVKGMQSASIPIPEHIVGRACIYADVHVVADLARAGAVTPDMVFEGVSSRLRVGRRDQAADLVTRLVAIDPKLLSKVSLSSFIPSLSSMDPLLEAAMTLASKCPDLRNRERGLFDIASHILQSKDLNLLARFARNFPEIRTQEIRDTIKAEISGPSLDEVVDSIISGRSPRGMRSGMMVHPGMMMPIGPWFGVGR